MYVYENNESESLNGNCFANSNSQRAELESGNTIEVLTKKQFLDSKEGINMSYKKGHTPWNKGKPRSEKLKRKLRQIHKGKRYSPRTEFKKGHIPWNKGLTKKTDERIRKSAKNSSKARMGIKLSELTKEKIREGHKGLPSWKKGLTRKTDKRINLPWNTGLTKETDKRLKKHSEFMEKRKITEEFRQKRREYMLNGNAVYVVSHVKNPSKPQLELYNYIKQTHPSAKINYPFCARKQKHYLLDVAIPKLKINFEYDGEYWHTKNQHGKDCRIKDFFRDEALIEQGWCVVRIKGREELNEVMK